VHPNTILALAVVLVVPAWIALLLVRWIIYLVDVKGWLR